MESKHKIYTIRVMTGVNAGVLAVVVSAFVMKDGMGRIVHCPRVHMTIALGMGLVMMLVSVSASRGIAACFAVMLQ